MKKRLLISGVALVLLITGGAIAYSKYRSNLLEGPAAPAPITLSDLDDKAPAPSETPAEPASLPDHLNIDMPFYTQAPTGNWDYPWQDACEEASVALVANLYLEKNWTRDEFNQQLLDLVDWQGKNGLDYHDTTVAETAQFMKANYGLEGVVHENPTFEDIEKILNEGHLIIGAFAGKMLHNPNFTNGGPIYHMLVIKGYDATKQQIVTHDVGTRNGADYVYSWSTVEAALHDWNPQDITLGAKLILEVLPPHA